MITTILWDVDGTLLDFQYSQKLALEQCFAAEGMVMTEEVHNRYSRINDDYWRRLELGEITREQLLNGRFLTLFEEFGIDTIDAVSFRKAYQAALGQVYAYIEGAPQICRRLRGRVKQYVITNGVAATQRNKLTLSGLTEYMEELFISEEIGAPKPALEFFEQVLERIEEKDKSCILVVGDSLSSDIKGGVLAGVKTCWYRPEGTCNPTPFKPDYEISRLEQVWDII